LRLLFIINFFYIQTHLPFQNRFLTEDLRYHNLEALKCVISTVIRLHQIVAIYKNLLKLIHVLFQGLFIIMCLWITNIIYKVDLNQYKSVASFSLFKQMENIGFPQCLTINDSNLFRGKLKDIQNSVFFFWLGLHIL